MSEGQMRELALRDAIDAADSAGNDVWNEVVKDPKWGAAQAAAVTMCRKRISVALHRLLAFPPAAD
jgi:hypothetical protein